MLAVAVTLTTAACGTSQADGAGHGALAINPGVRSAASPVVSAPSPHQAVAPAPIVDSGLDLRAGPVPVPLELRIPALGMRAPVLGVGITSKNVMDAPTGSASDPVWQKVFWYRGSGTPGEASTATIAGHVDDVLGRAAIFAHLKDLRPGDSIVVRDTRTGSESEFLVTQTAVYTLAQTLDPAVLSQIYGPGPVAGKGAQPSADGRSHLTLITCIGQWVTHSSTYDHRLVVYAVSLPRHEDRRG
jgi:sortase (surface protein transpeptidase)